MILADAPLKNCWTLWEDKTESIGKQSRDSPEITRESVVPNQSHVWNLGDTDTFSSFMLDLSILVFAMGLRQEVTRIYLPEFELGPIQYFHNVKI